MEDYYTILGISRTANESEIKNQYRKLAKIYHPDKNGGTKDSEEKFKLILEAYEILSNKESRLIYDIQTILSSKLSDNSTIKNQSQNEQNQKKKYRRKKSKPTKPITNSTVLFFVTIGIIIGDIIWISTSWSSSTIALNIIGIIWSSFWGLVIGNYIGQLFAE